MKTHIHIPFPSIKMAEHVGEITLIHKTLQGKIPYGYLNKSICGCGLTSYAIEYENDNIIIAVPNVAIITNKESQYPNHRYNHKILGIYKGIDYNQITEYIEECYRNKRKFKIITTYESLFKLENIIRNYDPHIILDESHQLFMMAQLKTKDRSAYEVDLITKIMHLLERHQHKLTFMSATPIPIRFFKNAYNWVENLDETTINWEGSEAMIPIMVKTKEYSKKLKELIINPLKNNGTAQINQHTFQKAIIYWNSIDNIINTIKNNKLTYNEVDLIIGEDSKDKVIEKVRWRDSEGKDITKIKNPDPHNLKKFTFITSAGFCGLDLYDNQAMNVVVSYYNEEKKNIMLDPNTELIQCIARQRSSGDNKNYFVFIHNWWEGELTEERRKEEIEYQILQRITTVCEKLNHMDHTERHHFVELLKESPSFKMYTIPRPEYDGTEKVYQWEFNRFMYDVRRYEIARIIMAYNKDKKAEIFNDLRQQNYLGEPEKYIPPKEYKYNSLRAILQEAYNQNQLSEHTLNIEEKDINPTILKFYNLVKNYITTQHKKISKHDIEHPTKFIKKAKKKSKKTSNNNPKKSPLPPLKTATLTLPSSNKNQ